MCQLNVRNEKCPDHGSIADYHALAASKPGLETTATVRGAREVSPGVVPALPVEGISRGAEVEAEVREDGGPRIDGGVSGEAGDAIREKAGEKARTDVRKSHDQLTRGLSQDRHAKVVTDVERAMTRAGHTREADSPR